MPITSCSDHPDIIINGHSDDQDLINHLADALSKENLKIWFPSASGQENNVNVDGLITETKVYIPVLSVSCLKLEEIKDRVSLAYISGRAIYPVAKQPYPALSAQIDGGMRLILSRIQWTFFLKEEHYTTNIGGLVDSIKQEINVGGEDAQPDANVIPADPYDLLRSRNHLASIFTGDVDRNADGPPTDSSKETDFWQRHFPKAGEVSITTLREKFVADYGDRIAKNYGADQRKLFENLLIKDVFELKHVVQKSMYDAFIGGPSSSKTDQFFDRISAYVTANIAMREVFDMNSTVRLTAIQHLAAFKTPPVIKHLRQLTRDKDPNIQAVAALALAKTGDKSEENEDLLIKMILNKDRLVRESVCLSLAHMKSKKAIKHILHLWRNDPIKHVREAAELALSRAGQDEAKEAMRITQVLTKEVAALKDMKSVIKKT